MTDWKRLATLGIVCWAVGFAVGRSIGPAPIEFPDPGASLDAQAIERGVREALAEPRSFPRTVALHRLLLQLPLENVAGVRRVFDEQIDTANPQDVQSFLAAWTHLDPYTAIDAALEWQSPARRNYGIGVIVREWASGEAGVKALTYLREEAGRETVRVAAAPLVRGWAQSGDVQGATRLAVQLASDDDYPGLEQALARGVFYSQGAEETIEWAQDLAEQEDSDFGTGILRTSIKLIAGPDPERGIRWLEANAERPLAKEILPIITGNWADKDPAAALLWLSTRPPGTERNRALSGAMQIWASANVSDAKTWLDARPLRGEALQAVLPPFLKRLARRDPKTASQWVDQLEDPKRRSNLIRRIARRWAALDPDAASAWLSELANSSDATLREAAGALIEAEPEPRPD